LEFVMPRDAAGTYTLPQAPFQPNTVARSALVNSNFSDIAAALTDSLALSNATAKPINGNLVVSGTVTATGAVINGALQALDGAFTSLTVNGPSAVNGNLTASGTITGATVVSTGNIQTNTGTISTGGEVLAGFGVFGALATPGRGGFVGSWCPNNNNYQGLYSDGNGNLTFSGASLAGVPSATMGYFHSPEASFWVMSEAYKPSGGVWATGSDARIKDVHGDYNAGLEAVCALRPRRFSYLGNDQPVPAEGAEPGQSPHAGVVGREYVGLVAQEAEIPMPEMVSVRPGLIDGERVDDLRSLDASALIYALCNAVRDLAGQVEALSARLTALEAA
jgi:hypothetical protein